MSLNHQNLRTINYRDVDANRDTYIMAIIIIIVCHTLMRHAVETDFTLNAAERI